MVELLYISPLHRQVAMTVQDRFGKHLLELGGNNCLIVAEDAEVRWRVCTVYSVQHGIMGRRFPDGGC